MQQDHCLDDKLSADFQEKGIYRIYSIGDNSVYIIYSLRVNNVYRVYPTEYILQGQGQGNGIYVSISKYGSDTPVTRPETDKAGLSSRDRYSTVYGECFIGVSSVHVI